MMSIFIGDYQYSATIFPDGCPQAWNVPVHFLSDSYEVTWKYENLDEFWIIAHLNKIISIKKLIIWYLPFGRQDKSITNQTTFGWSVFKEHLHLLDLKIEVLDGHPAQIMFHPGNFHPLTKNFNIPQFECVCFPDAGSVKRYSKQYSQFKQIHFNKVRDQSTGNIMGLNILPLENAYGSFENIHVIDDICDGGNTFLCVAKALTEAWPDAILHLKTTYGIYSKGKQCLRDAGYNSIECLYELPGRNPFND